MSGACTDCMLYDCCEKRIRYHADEDEFTGKKFTDMDIVCTFFERRSDYVKIPFQIGETVYSIKTGEVVKCTVSRIQIVTRVSIDITLLTEHHTFYDISVKDIDKIVFTSEEAAEEACAKKHNKQY